MQNTSDFKALWDGKDEEERRALSKKVVCMWRNDWEQYFLEYVKLNYKSENLIEELWNLKEISNNLLRFVGREKGAIYSTPPSRTLEGYEPNDPVNETAIAAYEADDATNMALDTACQLAIILIENGLWVRVDPETGMMDLEIVTPDRISVKPNALKPTEIDAIVIQKKDESGWWAYTRELAVEYDSSWRPMFTDENGQKQTATYGQELNTPNKAGVIPVVIAHSLYPSISFWNAEESKSLVDSNMQLAFSRTHSRYKEKYQSWIQGYIKEPGEGFDSSQIATGPGNFIEVGPSGEIGTFDFQADLVGDIETQHSQIEMQLGLQGLAGDKIRGNGNAASGYALKVSRESQEIEWKKQRRLWMRWEQMLFKTFVAIRAVEYAGPAIPLDAKLMVNFSEVGIGEDAAKTTELHEKKIGLGILSPVEAIMEDRGVNREQAEELFAQIQLDNARIGGFPLPTGEE